MSPSETKRAKALAASVAMLGPVAVVFARPLTRRTFGVKGNTLPWWAIGYCTLLAVIGAMGAFSDAKRSALWYPVGQIVASAGEVLLVMAYFDNATRYAIGELVIPALFGVLTFETYAGVRDVREIEPDPELSDRDNAIAKRIGIVAGLLLIAPALLAGAALTYDWIKG